MKNKKVSITVFVLLAGFMPALEASDNQQKTAALDILSQAGTSVAKIVSSKNTQKAMQKHVAGEVCSFICSYPAGAFLGLYALQLAHFYKSSQIDREPEGFNRTLRDPRESRCIFEWDIPFDLSDTFKMKIENIVRSFYETGSFRFEASFYQVDYQMCVSERSGKIIINISSQAFTQLFSNNEHEFAVTLVHELAHVMYGHQKKFKEMIYGSSSCLLGAALIHGSAGDEALKSYFLGMIPIASGLVFHALMLLSENFMIKPQELQADAFAYRYTDSKLLKQHLCYLKQFPASEKPKNVFAQLKDFWFSTHASTPESIAMIEAELARRPE